MATPVRRPGFRPDDLAVMTPEQLLDEARAARLTVAAEQGKLVVRGARNTEPDLVQALLSRKPDLMPVLMRASLDEREWVEERAAIAEYDGGLPPAEAERLAWADLEARRASEASGGTTS
jgi:hypothetical protein